MKTILVPLDGSSLAEQAIPLLAFMVAGAAPRLRWSAVIGGTTLYVALTLAVFAQAIAGRPLLPL